MLYLHVWHQLAEAVQQAAGHGAGLVLRDRRWMDGQQHSQEAVPEEGVLGLPLRLTVQVA